MPTTYAHYKFGGEVKEMLPAKENQIITTYRKIYDMGIYGPDILFFYKPYKQNKIRKLGSKHHHQEFIKILEYAAEKIKEQENPAEYMAYMYGFMCHFALDSYCHGYINHTKATKGLGHNLMEAEFDRYLMEEDGINPLKHKPTAHMQPDEHMAEVISTVYMEVEKDVALKSAKTTKTFCNFITAPNIFSRFFVYAALLVSGNLGSKGGMIIKHKKNKACEETTKEINRLYNKAKKLAVKLICEFEDNIYSGKPFSKVCNHTLSTTESVEDELDADMLA